MTARPISAAGAGERYRAPALEKGLDILELLAGRAESITQSQIAGELGRSVAELFRMLACLESRGYIARGPAGEGYTLTMRLHEIANTYPPTRRLLDLALPAMRALALRTRQSCHLGVYNQGRLYVVAQVESPEPVGFTVRLATGFSLLRTASGRVLLAFQPAPVQAAWLDAMQPPVDPALLAGLPARLGRIRERGWERVEGETLRGITDLSRPILDPRGHALAALTVPSTEITGVAPGRAAIAAELALAAAGISRRLGGGSG
jgi:DNA-binding IclR family transcriptional regulator